MGSITSNVAELIAKIQARVLAMAPDSPRVKEALTRIGLYVSSLAKLEARRQGIIDTGRLVNSIRYEFFKEGSIQGVRIGSFGVKYAAMHEFGGPFRDQQRRAMFASMRNRGAGPRASKGVVIGNRFRARPYLRPSFRKSQLFIIDTIRAAVGFAEGV